MSENSDSPAPASRRRRARRRIVLIVIAVFVVALLAHGERRVHTGYAAGHTLHGQTQAVPADKTTVRFATFNIRGGKGQDGVRSLDRIAGCLEGFDVIGLNEVHGPLHLFSDRDQAKVLGETMELAWLFAPTEHRWWRDHFGNAMLSNLPVTNWQRIPLAGTRRKGHRNILHAVIPINGQELHVLITHLTRRETRKDQLKTVIEKFLDIDPPVVLMGDFNTLPTDPQIGGLLSTPGVVEPVIHVLGDQSPASRVDWIFVRGLEVVDAGIIDRGASDHPCVWAELRLTTQPTQDSTVNKPD